MADAPVGAGPAQLSAGARTAAALALALVALGLLVTRSWRIDFDYSIDFQTYWLAGRRVVTGEAARLYDAGGGEGDGTPAAMAAHEFKNLPIVAAAFAPLATLPYIEAKRIFWWLSLGAVVAGGALSGVALLPHTLGSKTARAALAVAGAAALAPTHAALRHGQTTPFVMLALACAFAARARGRNAVSGGWLGAASVVKFPPLALVLLDAVRGRGRAVAGALVAAGAAAAASLALFGPALNRAYVVGLAQHAGTVMTGHNNQSLLAIAMRLVEPSLVNDWTPRPAPAGVAAAALLATAALAALAAGALFRSRRSRDERLEAPMALALGTIALPVAWDHYALLFVPALCALVAGLEAKGLLSLPRFVVPLAGASAVLALPTPEPLLAGGVAGPIAAVAISGDGLAMLVIFAVATAALVASPRREPVG